jgi:Tfp pilus assembly protein PilV
MVCLAKKRSREGATMVEVMIATVIALVLVLVLGWLLMASQSTWESGRDKTELQANTTEALEWMARSIRESRRLTVVNTSEFWTFDETGSLVHTYRLDTSGTEPRLQVDGQDLATRHCTQFMISADDDTTSLTLVLELEDRDGDRVIGMTRVALRNRTLTF